MRSTIHERLAGEFPVILDGATGTELARRGIDLNVPSWTAGVILDHPEILKQIHRDYVDAGAEIITANTFRTHARNLQSLGEAHLAKELTSRAVEIAQEAAGGKAYVAASVAPLEDCYTPSLTPAIPQLIEEHHQMAEHLRDAGVDLILIETQVTTREAVIASQAARSTGLPFAVSLTCSRDGNVFSGESLVEAYQRIAEFEPVCFLVNCIPADEVLSTLAPVIALNGPIPLGAYANTGRLLANGVWEATSGENPAVYAEFTMGWKQSGLKIIGGCCGTTPEHTSHLHKTLYSQPNA